MHKHLYISAICLLVNLAGSAQEVKTRTLELAMPCDPNATVFLEAARRHVAIRTTHENKVRLVTTVYYKGSPKLTDSAWLGRLSLHMRGTVNDILVEGGNLKSVYPLKKDYAPIPYTGSDTGINEIETFDSTGLTFEPAKGIRRKFILYIPQGVKLNIESQYADISLDSNVQHIKARTSRGSLTLKETVGLNLTGEYIAIFAGAIFDAQIDITNGRLNAKKIDFLDLRSKNSVIDLGAITRMKINSEVDDCEILEAGRISGTKNYGDLRVASLLDSLDLTGVNADIKLREIKPEVTLIRIDDKYAELRLPATDLKNYSVNFQGADGTIYTPFDRPPAADSTFQKIIGTGKPTEFRIRCDKCTLDMK